MCSKSKSTVYVKDMRKVITFYEKRLKYPKNYHKIVKNGEIKQSTDSDGNTVLKLLYGEVDKNGMRPAFTLVHVVEDVCHSKAYYTIYGLLCPIEELSKSYFEPFGFSRIDLKKYLPVIDIKKTDDPNNAYQLVNTLYLARKGCSVDIESGEVTADSRKDKGLNGKLLYYSIYEKLDPSFCVIKDENEKVEYDKTVLCFIVSLFVYSVIFIRKLLTFLPMKFGECLLRQQNVVAKILGNIFFTPFVPLKVMVDVTAILVKSLIILFVSDKKKYGDSYFVLWKHELIACFDELKSDCSLIKNGERPSTESNYDTYRLIGTWHELDVRYHVYES